MTDNRGKMTWRDVMTCGCGGKLLVKSSPPGHYCLCGGVVEGTATAYIKCALCGVTGKQVEVRKVVRSFTT